MNKQTILSSFFRSFPLNTFTSNVRHAECCFQPFRAQKASYNKTRVCLITFAICLGIGFTGSAADYYVSPAGSDSNSGISTATPFKTIQKAANIMTAGDTCYIRSGTYRETVTPQNSGLSGSPLRFTRYGTESVEVTGLDVVASSGWSVSSGAIYQTAFSSTIAEVFVNGQRVPKARYPAEPENLFDTSTMMNVSVQTDKIGKFYGQNFAPNFWNGATFVAITGPRWIAHCGRINTSGSDNYTVSTVSSNWGAPTLAGDGKGYLTNSLNALYTAGQWHYQNGTLYLWTKNSANPSTTLVEGQVRLLGFDVSGKSYIQIDGLDFRAATARMRNSQNCEIRNSTFRFVAPFQHFTKSFNRQNISPDSWEYTGIEISGSGNLLSGCYINGSWGDGISVWGTDNTIENCKVENTNWSRTDSACISVTGTGHTITSNTLRTSGRCIIVHRQLKQGLITLNDLSQAGRGGLTDLGVTYDFANDGANTEISYNWIHDNLSTGPGVYLDGSCQNHLVHHNVIWNCSPAILCNAPSINAAALNNSFYNVSSNIKVDNTQSSNFMTLNNLAPVNNFPGNAVSNNVAYGTLSPYLDEKNFDFRLSPSTAAIDAGAFISNVTVDVVGAAPDAGAYELGGTDWTPGSSILTPAFADVPPPNPDRFKVESAGLHQNQLKWRDRSSTELGFRVYRRASSEPGFTLIKTLPANTSSFLDTTASPGITYKYMVTAYNAAGESGGTEEANVQTLANNGPVFYARNYNAMQGVTVANGAVGSCDSNDWIMFSNVDLQYQYSTFHIYMSAITSGKTVEIRLDSPTGSLIGTLTTMSTGSWTTFQERSVVLTTATSGIHNLYLVFKGGSGVGNFIWFQFRGGQAIGTPFIQSIEFEPAAAVSGAVANGRGYTSCDNADWIRVSYVDLGLVGPKSMGILCAVSPATAGRFIDVRMDHPTTGMLIGTLTTVSTGSGDTYRRQSMALADTASGIHDLYFVFRGGSSVANVDSFDISKHVPLPGTASTLIQAESYNSAYGVNISGTYIGSLDSNDWVRYNSVNFGSSGSAINFRLALPPAQAGRTIEARVDSVSGPIVGVLKPSSTGAWTTFQMQYMDLSSVSGIRDLYLVFRGGSGAANIDYIQIEYNP